MADPRNLCYAYASEAVKIWREALLVENSEPDRAEMLKGLAKQAGNMADAIANKGRVTEFHKEMSHAMRKQLKNLALDSLNAKEY